MCTNKHTYCTLISFIDIVFAIFFACYVRVFARFVCSVLKYFVCYFLFIVSHCPVLFFLLFYLSTHLTVIINLHLLLNVAISFYTQRNSNNTNSGSYKNYIGVFLVWLPIHA